MSPRRISSTVLSRVSIRVMSAFAIWQGVKILATDESGFGSPGYVVVRQVPGGMYTWGAVLVLAGVLTLVGSITLHYRVKAAGLFAIAIWCFAFGAGVLGAPTGSPVYFVVGYCAAGLILVDERRRV